MKPDSKQRWIAVSVFFAFMLLHQTDKLLIGPLTTDIIHEFNLTKAQMGFVTTGSLLVGAIFYPLWGYLYDRYARARLLALASFLWGATTWLGAIAPTYRTFLAARATTGIDDSSYPGIYSLISDYFLPHLRGKIYGLLELTMPIGYLLGMILGIFLSGTLGWRSVFYITGSLGVALALVILVAVREPARGSSEPELAGLEHLTTYKFNWQAVRDLFSKPTLRILFIQGFFGVFPWNVITYWVFNYLETERGYDEGAVLATMVPAILMLAAGYPLGGALGDYFFKRTQRGRAMVAAVGVLGGAVLMFITLHIPVENRLLFGVMLAMTGLFIPLAAPNVVATVYDVTVPEVRSTALSVQYFIESSGAALAPGIAGLIADATSLRTAFLLICIVTWIVCGVFFALVMRTAPGDIDVLRGQMRRRAEREQTGGA